MALQRNATNHPSQTGTDYLTVHRYGLCASQRLTPFFGSLANHRDFLKRAGKEQREAILNAELNAELKTHRCPTPLNSGTEAN